MQFRKYVTKKGTLVLAGRDAKNNEALIAQTQKKEIVLHTHLPGSPFVNIKGTPKFGDIKEAAIFCARYSKDWKKNKGDVIVHRFKGSDVFKEKGMKTGTFGVRRCRTMKIKKKWIQGWDK